MESIDVLTGQHVTIEYEPASVLQRMGALLLDYFFMFLYIIALSFIFSFARVGEDAITITIYVILVLPIICYHVVFESFMNGKTPGKVIAKIRVTNVDGSTPGFLSYFLRWILLPVDMFPYGGIGALCIVFTEKHQRLGDLAAGTTVVKTVAKSSLNDFDNEFYEFNDNYQPTFKEVDVLTDGQIRLISDLLQNLNTRDADNALSELAEKIKQKLKINSDLPDRDFLDTIVRDYNYYALK
jgi:uncharacterized RDD family membrane protein YckC